MLGLIILVLTALGSGVAALSIWGHSGWLWQILASVAVINTVAAWAVLLRRASGRRVTLMLLGAQIVGAVVGLAVVAFVEVRDIPLGGAITLLVYIFVPVVAAIIAVSLLAAWSINSLAWPHK